MSALLFNGRRKGPSDLLKKFAKLNGAFWQSQAHSDPGDGYALISIDSYPAMCLSSASFGAIASRAHGLRPLFVEPRVHNHRVVLESYPNAEIVSLSKCGFRALINGFYNALKTFFSLKSPRDLLALHVDGIHFGDIIYDVVLAYGYATVSRIDRKVFRALFAFYRHRYYARRILACYDVKLGVFHQMLGLVDGVLSKYLLDRGIESINRVGSYEFCARKYYKIEDCGDHPIKPLREHFEEMRANPETYVAAAEAYLDRRVRGQVTRIDADLAYKNKKVYEDRNAFCSDYGLDPNKPIVFVMLHAFNDWPHRANKHMLFQDYYHWFAHTVDVIREVPDTNWVVKEHPAAVQFYRTHDLNVKAYLESRSAPNVALIEADADFSTTSVMNLAQAIVTGVGTSGLEFAAFGIPCVLAAEGAYSGFDIAIQPSSVDEYDAQLRKAKSLGPLAPEQVLSAKLVAYFYFRLMNSERFHFCPEVEMSRLHAHDVDYADEFWQAAGDLLEDVDRRKLLEEQLYSIGAYVTDPKQVQYWNRKAT